MYIQAQIVRVAATTDKCSCGGTMTVIGNNQNADVIQ